MVQDGPSVDKWLPPRALEKNEGLQSKGAKRFPQQPTVNFENDKPFTSGPELSSSTEQQIERNTEKQSCSTANGQDVNDTAKSVTSAARDVVGDPEVQAAHALLQLKFGTKKDTSTGTQNTDIESFKAENERLKAENESLKAENERLKETITCKICRDNRVNVVFSPCRHLVCCESCSSHFRREGEKCPICRHFVERCIKIFS